MNDTSSISGNAPNDVKVFIAQMINGSKDVNITKGFAKEVAKLLTFEEISVNKNVEEPTKLDGRVVCRIVVDDVLLNAGASVHGGCIAFLIDVCSTLALVTQTMVATGTPHTSVSQSLNIVYHSPAVKGDELRIVNSTVSVGSRVLTLRTEIWNVTRQRLTASGVHIKMQPSQEKQKL